MLSTHLLTQPPEYICFYNAIRDEERRAVTMLTEEQPDVLESISIEKSA